MAEVKKDLPALPLIKCKKTLYWHQVTTYSGDLDERRKKYSKDDVVTLVFKKGKEYPHFAYPYHTTLSYITIYAIGEDGKARSIYHQEVHTHSVDNIIEHFNFKVFDEVP